MKSNVIFGFLGLVMLELAGCGLASPLTQANLDKIHDDMSPADVKTILGQPSDSHTDPIPVVGGTTTTYTYSGTSADVVLVFKNDLLKEKHGSFSK